MFILLSECRADYNKNTAKMRKRSLVILIMLSLTAGVIAQNVDDALRYSQVFYTGSARFMSMGGAFTALGGDLSTLSQNPAGLGVFRSSEISVSPQLFHINTIANFKGTSTEDYIYEFGLGQGGIVFSLPRRNKESEFTSLNFGYSYNQTNNLNQQININGVSNNSSLTDYWAGISENYFHDELVTEVPDAFLAYDVWLIDTLSGSNVDYGTVYSNYGDNLPSVYGQTVQRLISTEGYTNEHAFSFGGSYSNKLFFGATVGITRLRYTSKYEHLESTDEDLLSLFTDFNYTFFYENIGTGYTIKLGAIYKPVEALRIGLGFHSPGLFRIDEYVNDNITSHFSDVAVPYESSNEAVRYNYALTTPFRLLAGVALQIKKVGMISIDYEFIDYGSAKFSETGDGYNYSEKNLSIKNSLQPVSNLRLGAEARLNNLYFRGGYGYYGKAWKSDELNGDLDHNSFSLGTGFRAQNIFVDFGFTRLTNPNNYLLYDAEIEAPMSDMSVNRNIFTLTFGYKFGL
jgi:hypothetical protein